MEQKYNWRKGLKGILVEVALPNSFGAFKENW